MWGPATGLNSTTLTSSLAGRRPARHQLLSRYPTCDQLASRSASSSRAGSRAASELDEDLRAHVVCRRPNSITRSISLAGSRAALQHASELDSVMKFGLNWTTCEYANLRIANSQAGVDNSRTGQLADVAGSSCTFRYMIMWT